jgi:hypothetical protein
LSWWVETPGFAQRQKRAEYPGGLLLLVQLGRLAGYAGGTCIP